MSALRLKIAVSLVLLPLLLAVAEWATKTFKGAGEARSDSIAGGYMPVRLRGNFEGTVLGLPFRTNRFGFRGEEEFAEEPAADEYRILALGDSVGVGLGIESGDHYTKVLERELNRGGGETRFHVINAAGQGYSPSSYLAFLKHDGLKLGPRAVLVQIELCNDVSDEALLNWGGQKAEDLEIVRGGRYVVAWDGNLLGTVSRGPYFFERTYLYTLIVRRTLSALASWFPPELFQPGKGTTYFNLGFDRYLLNSARIEQGWQRLFGALEATHAWLAERDIAFWVLIVPSRYTFEAPSVYHDFATGVLDRARGLAREKGLSFVDPGPVLAQHGGEQLYFDFAHPTAEGNRWIGLRLFQEFSGLVAAEAKPSSSNRAAALMPSSSSTR